MKVKVTKKYKCQEESNKKENICKYFKTFYPSSIYGPYNVCYAQKGAPQVNCGGHKNICEIWKIKDE